MRTWPPLYRRCVLVLFVAPIVLSYFVAGLGVGVLIGLQAWWTDMREAWR